MGSIRSSPRCRRRRVRPADTCALSRERGLARRALVRAGEKSPEQRECAFHVVKQPPKAAHDEVPRTGERSAANWLPLRAARWVLPASLRAAARAPRLALGRPLPIHEPSADRLTVRQQLARLCTIKTEKQISYGVPHSQREQAPPPMLLTVVKHMATLAQRLYFAAGY
jgi:hypothetical protein